ncbi:traB domain-containing protein isoform X2 [Culicoides brevitarsis]|uniref:traB domain-containing protein isoform X2 n=1 Tax=Culicoides brevitarsis TaxID=469753 RepID=UPI00307CB17A
MSLSDSSVKSYLDTSLNKTDEEVSINAFSSVQSNHFEDFLKTNENTTIHENQHPSCEFYSAAEPHERKNQSDKEKAEEDEIKIYSNLEEFEKNLPETVTVLNAGENKAFLVGTAHFSEKSKNDVSFVIRNVQPDVVMVELCPSRVHLLRHDEKTLLEEAKDINLTKIRNVIKTNGVVNGLFYILLINMNAKITKDLGMAPGGEFRRAVSEINQLNHCFVSLGDRPINITLKRALCGLSLFQKLKLVWKLITFDEQITTEGVEQCKQKDLLEELMKEMTAEFPAFGDVFVKERDLYLCHSLQLATLSQQGRPTKSVGIVGIGHVEGIAKNWGKVNQNQIQEILTIPPTSMSNKVFLFTIKYGILSLIGFGLLKFVKPKIKGFL